MKKFFALMLAIVMLLSMAVACTKKEETKPAETKPAIETVDTSKATEAPKKEEAKPAERDQGFLRRCQGRAGRPQQALQPDGSG